VPDSWHILSPTRSTHQCQKWRRTIQGE